MREWHELLSRVELFAGLNPKERELLLSAAEEREVRRRERLLSPQSADHFLYLVTRGALKTVRSNGKENLLVDFHKPGDLLGEDCALLTGESDMLALPFDNATVLQIPAENFSKVMESQPRFGRALASMCALRAKSFRERLYFMMAAPVPVRLASALYLLAKNFGKRDRQGVLIGLRVTHQDLADYIGASRETVTLFLSKFKQDGLIIMKVRKIIIPDLKALKKVGAQ
jgi:CRP/FNR family transcriptional regulator, cyclic AMP receptor protein